MQVSNGLGIIGLGDMGGAIADNLYSKGHPLVLYDRSEDKCSRFVGLPHIQIANSVGDLVKKLESREGSSTVWMMVKGGQTTNDVVDELSGLMRDGDVIIDGSNSRYIDSMKNYEKLKSKGISYLDVGCAGGPNDIATGLSLMIGGDKDAFKRTEHIFNDLSGNGTYGYVGGSGSGHRLKLIHNLIFYGIFPVYSEAAALLGSDTADSNGMDINESLRLLESSPPITHDILSAIRDAFEQGSVFDDSPQINVSDAVSWFNEHSKSAGTELPVIDAILGMYGSMSDRCRSVYSKAKKIITGH